MQDFVNDNLQGSQFPTEYMYWLNIIDSGKGTQKQRYNSGVSDCIRIDTVV